MTGLELVIIAILGGWGWSEITEPPPICYYQETIDNQIVYVPKECDVKLIQK